MGGSRRETEEGARRYDRVAWECLQEVLEKHFGGKLTTPSRRSKRESCSSSSGEDSSSADVVDNGDVEEKRK